MVQLVANATAHPMCVCGTIYPPTVTLSTVWPRPQSPFPCISMEIGTGNAARLCLRSQLEVNSTHTIPSHCFHAFQWK